jgi:D-amino-acid dehydrogenase
MLPFYSDLRADWNQWAWGLSFLRECTPSRTRHNIRQIVNLGMFSRATLQQLRAQTGLQYQQRTQGILHFYTSQAEFDAAQEPARIMREHGCELDMKTPDECVAIEPALAQCRSQLVGGSMTPSDESGDAHQFTQGLAALCAQAGVKFLYDTRIVGLQRQGDAVSEVQVADAAGVVRSEKADGYVLCLGSFSTSWAKQLGISLRIYPAKGYSVTLPVIAPDKSYEVSLTDDEYKLVFSRFGDRLRIAGTAELNGYSTDLNLQRCHAIVRRVKALFPGDDQRRGRPVLDRSAACHAKQRPLHRPQQVGQLLPQYRPWDLGVDARLRLGASHCRFDRRAQTRNRFLVCWTRLANFRAGSAWPFRDGHGFDEPLTRRR